jgi:hypothetical protein
MSAIAAISKCAKGLCGKDPGLTWKEAISLASEMYRNGEVAVAGRSRSIRKKSANGTHTDTASHNVNIRVVSGSRKPAATLTGKQLIAYADVLTTYEQWDYDAKPVKTIPQAITAIKAAGMTVRKAGTKYKIS